jgi:phage tail sheath protein FI
MELMTRSDLNPGEYIEEIAVRNPSVAAVPTSIAAFIGWAARGPVDHPALVRGWADFEGLYGGFDAGSGYLPHAVNHYFANGGGEAYIVRLASNGPIPIRPRPFGTTGRIVPPPAPAAPRLNLQSSIAPALDQLEKIDLFNILCFPGETSTAIVEALEEYCERRRAFLIVDSDPGVSDPSAVSGPPTKGANAAAYFPWVLAPDPSNQNQPAPFPPSGCIAGIYARMDASRGVWKAPAGTEAVLQGITGVTVALNDSQTSPLEARAVNAIRTFAGSGVVAWGARTTQAATSGSEWKYVPVRRTALFIEESICRGLQWVVFEPNGQPLWMKIQSTVGDFLEALFRQGAFQGATPAQAFFVKCDSTTTTQVDIDNGRVNILVGFAPLRPAEFVIIRIQQTAAKP